MMDVSVSNRADKPQRKVAASAQMSIVDEGSQTDDESSETDDSEEDEDSADEAVLDEEELLLVSADPKIHRKVRIANFFDE
jgi:hypothetical protein